MNKQYTDKQYTDKQYTDKQYTDKQYTDKQHTDKQYTDKQYTDKQYTDKQHTNKQYTDKQHTNKQHPASRKQPQITRHRRHRLLPGLFVLLCHGTLAGADTATSSDAASGRSTDRDLKTHAVDFLQGRRLFFDSQERMTTSFSQTGPSADEQHPLSGPAEAATVARSHDVKVNSISKSRAESKSSVTLQYQARIESADAVIVIVNGQPCQRALSQLAGRTDATRRTGTDHSQRLIGDESMITCSALADTGLILFLLADSRSLKVMKGRHLMGVLQPGQTL